MSIEIEHRYLVDTAKLPKLEAGLELQQGYLNCEQCAVRVRLSEKGCELTFKTRSKGPKRTEYNIPIARELAEALLRDFQQGKRIQKTRKQLQYKGKQWTIDCFKGELEGLCIAELELKNEAENYEKPPFLGENITHLEAYSNSALSQNPLKSPENR